MNPEDLIIVDYPSLFKSPTPPIANPLIDSKDSSTDDPIIKLNQAWEKEVKSRDIFTDWVIMEMKKKWEKYSRIGSVVPGFSEI